MKCKLLSAILSFSAIFLIFTVSHVSAVAVMSIDLGSEWMKIAIVSPGVPMEIILNTDSSRKTPVALGFRDGERFVGDAALNLGVRFPEKTFTHFIDLLGKTSLNDVAVKNYQANFPYHVLVETDNGIAFVLKDNNQETLYTPEELLSMLLAKARHYAEVASAASSPSGKAQIITDCVLSIPPYLSQVERRALKHSASLAGIKILQLMNINTAFALNYGVFRRKDFNSTPTNILFYDLGAANTVATIASYKIVSTKERGYVEKNPQVEIKGVGYDRYLGGFQLQLKLRDLLLKLFSEQSKKTIDEVKSNKRAMAKLLKEAGRLKKVLSANTEHKAQIENVMNDIDFKTIVTRETFETLVGDMLAQRVIAPLETAFKTSGFTLGEIDSFIIVGGGTRIPKVQKQLEDYFGRDLSKNLNADEAGALGAAYQAAFLSKGFKVKTFHVKDYNLYSISVDFTKNSEDERTISRVLFGVGNSYPQKKVITFSKHKQDFDITVNYNEAVPQDTQKEIAKISLKEIEQAFAKYSGNSSVESKGIKVHFRMDESGLFNLESAEVLFEMEYEEVEGNPNLEKMSEALGDAFQKLGDTISGLFNKSENETDSGETSENATDSQTADNTQNQTAEKSQDAQEAPAEAAPVKKEIKKKNLKEILSTESLILDQKIISKEALKESKEKLKKLDEIEEAKLKRDSAYNALESFISETRDKLEQDKYSEASTEEQKENIRKELSAAGEWMEYESDGADHTGFEGKLKNLKSLTKEIFARVREHEERPEALASLRNMLNITEMFYANAMNVSEEDQIFTQVELTALRKLIDDTQSWMVEGETEQASLAKSENPKLTIRSVGEKMSVLDREVKYLLNKARLAPPKKAPKKEEPKKESTSEEKAKSNDESTINDVPVENGETSEQQPPVEEAPEHILEDISPDPVSQEPQKTEL